MARILQSEQAARALREVPAPVQQAIEERLDYLREMPRMYEISSDERFPGCRSFWVDPCYRVFYMVLAEGQDVYLMAVVREDLDM